MAQIGRQDLPPGWLFLVAAGRIHLRSSHMDFFIGLLMAGGFWKRAGSEKVNRKF